MSYAPVSLAQKNRALKAQILGFTLSIHVPAIMALNEGMQALGYSASDMKRIESMQVLTQSIVAGSAEVGESDVVSALRAGSVGADVKMVGMVYNTSQVLVVNADKIKSYADFKNKDNAIALNSTGDFIYVMLSGIFERNGINIEDATVVDVGGSGSRMRALLGGRVAAVPVHFDQAADILKQGNYKVMVEPWKIYNPWLSEAWLVQGSWLKNADNVRAITDLLKATVTSFRKTNQSLSYFAEGYRKYATVKDAKTATEEQLRPVWEALSKQIKAWPDDGGFRLKYFEELLPVYVKAGTVKRGTNIAKTIDTQYMEKALKELG
jgi:NitT/TauT family transport system substrate-binding protein